MNRFEDGAGLSTVLADAPDINPQQQQDLDAFWTLHRARQSSQPIRLSEIQAYCHLTGIRSVEEQADLTFLIQEMDAEWRDWAAERQAAAQKAQSHLNRQTLSRGQSS
ncbi:MAG: phage tail assembly chaperone [Magnetospiraceae bacterium]